MHVYKTYFNYLYGYTTLIKIDLQCSYCVVGVIILITFMIYLLYLIPIVASWFTHICIDRFIHSYIRIYVESQHLYDVRPIH